MKFNKQSITIIIVVAVIGILGLFKWYQSRPIKPVDSVAQRSIGSTNAKVQIIEFIDFQCPACAYGYDLLHKYLAKYPGQLHIQVKYFPLTQIHRHAVSAGLYAECAARQGKFWEVVDQMMPAQQQWAELISADGMFSDMAKKAGLDMTALNTCLSSEDAKQALDDERMLGQSLNIQSTPTYFINNKMVVGGKSLLEELSQYFPGGV